MIDNPTELDQAEMTPEEATNASEASLEGRDISAEGTRAEATSNEGDESSEGTVQPVAQKPGQPMPRPQTRRQEDIPTQSAEKAEERTAAPTMSEYMPDTQTEEVALDSTIHGVDD